MAEGSTQFGRIQLAARGPTSEGSFKVTSSGIVWKKSGGGGRHIDIPTSDIGSIRWTRTGKFCQLCITRLQHSSLTFQGFREQDHETIAGMCSRLLGKKVEQKQMTANGQNWGDASINGTMLNFNSVQDKLTFAVNISDVVLAQLGGNKSDVRVEFQTDDTGGSGMDALCEMAIHVPADHPGYSGGDDSAAQGFLTELLRKTDAGAVTSADAIVSFTGVAVLAPRGRFDVEMHGSFLKLYGQSQEFRVAYSSISRLFILPKTAQPHTLVSISLDPPIRKGQTYYQHILCQFHTDDESDITLGISDELFESKNEQCGGKLQREFQGTTADVFAKVVRGLAAAKITRTGNFRAADSLSLAIKCSYKADLGHLYPLERAFFYITKPPLLITHEEVESVEFQRQGKDSLAVAKTFDFIIRLKNDQEYQFRNIQKNEWSNLFEWSQAKNLRIENLAEAQEGPGGPGGIALALAAAADDEEEEEDEDFQIGSADEDDGEPSDEDSVDGSDVNSDDMSGGSDAEAGTPKPKKQKKSAAPSPKKRKEAKPAKAEKAEKAPPKKRAKKDKNAPKKNMSAYMFFFNDIRETVKQENPESTFGDIGKIIGAKWKGLSDDGKVKYNKMAEEDKGRYEAQNKDYKAKKAAEAADDNEDDE